MSVIAHHKEVGDMAMAKSVNELFDAEHHKLIENEYEAVNP